MANFIRTARTAEASQARLCYWVMWTNSRLARWSSAPSGGERRFAERDWLSRTTASCQERGRGIRCVSWRVFVSAALQGARGDRWMVISKVVRPAVDALADVDLRLAGLLNRARLGRSNRRGYGPCLNYVLAMISPRLRCSHGLPRPNHRRISADLHKFAAGPIAILPGTCRPPFQYRR